MGTSKTLRQVLGGTSDASIRFDAISQLPANLGFEMRVRGSHHIFRKARIEEKVNLQREGSEAKPYQVCQETWQPTGSGDVRHDFVQLGDPGFPALRFRGLRSADHEDQPFLLPGSDIQRRHRPVGFLPMSSASMYRWVCAVLVCPRHSWAVSILPVLRFISLAIERRRA